MNYKLKYSMLVDHARGRLLECYTEKHRIIPGCMGGTYVSENVVRLTPEEHYLAHQLLVKMYPNEPKLVYAAKMMTVDHNGQRVNNKMYGWLKRRFSKQHSKAMKGTKRSAESCKKQSESMLGIRKSLEHCANIAKARTGKKHTQEARDKMSRSSKGQVAWNKGIPRTDEEKRNISNARMGQPSPLKGIKTERDAWNKGKTGMYSKETINQMSEAKKGKTWEEIYGIEQAKQMKLDRSLAKKGKTWEEIYGVEDARERRAAHKARAKA